jgi:hypothetical protein
MHPAHEEADSECEWKHGERTVLTVINFHECGQYDNSAFTLTAITRLSEQSMAFAPQAGSFRRMNKGSMLPLTPESRTTPGRSRAPSDWDLPFLHALGSGSLSQGSGMKKCIGLSCTPSIDEGGEKLEKGWSTDGGMVIKQDRFDSDGVGHHVGP